MRIDDLLKGYEKEVADKKKKVKPANWNPTIQRAVNMRLSGMLFKDIGKAMGVSKSCVSIWCRGLIDSTKAAELTANGNLIGMKLRIQAKADRQELVKEFVANDSKISAREIGRRINVDGTTISKDIRELFGERLRA